MEFYATVCRLCEESTKTYDEWLDLFAEVNEQLRTKIQALANIEIHAEDKLPKRICGRCHKNMQQAYDFKLQCETTDARLRREIAFLERNNWNTHLPVVRFEDSRQFLEMGETTQKQEPRLGLPDTDTTIEPIFIKSEEPEEKLLTDVEQFLTKDLRAKDEPKTSEFFMPIEAQGNNDDKNIIDQPSSSESEESDSASSSDQELTVKLTEKQRSSRNSKNAKGGRYLTTCETCGKQFDKPSAKYSHMYAVHGEKRFKCKVCSKGFMQLQNLQGHEAIHSRTGDVTRPFECPECGRRYTRRNAMKAHMKDAHNDNLPFVCDRCGKGFVSVSKLTFHYTVHIESRDFLCGVCSKGFKSQAQLNKHTTTHLPRDQRKISKRLDQRKTSICQFCGKISYCVGTHKMHIRTHTGEQRYECHVCLKRFTSYGSHKKHLLVHSGEKPHVCEFCNKAFRQKHHMTTHIRGVHTDERPYQCKYCPKTFATRGNMSMHERSHADPDAVTVISSAAVGVKPNQPLDGIASEEV